MVITSYKDKHPDITLTMPVLLTYFLYHMWSIMGLYKYNFLYEEIMKNVQYSIFQLDHSSNCSRNCL